MAFTEATAAEYDDTSVRGDEAETVEFLRGLAGDGPVLELAIGTGRTGLPLAATGLRVELSPSGIRFFPVVTRYVWPSELDLMARIAGLRLHDRWSGWAGEPFTADSKRHASVYGR